MKFFINLLFLSGLFLTTAPSVANDSLSTFMQQLKSNTAVKMAYKETRKLELLDNDWLGSGYLYALPPRVMIREQLEPKRLLMAIKGNTLFYFDPEKGTRYKNAFDHDDELSLSIGVFKALVNADETLLQNLYYVDFSGTDKSWLMHLKPRHDSNSELRIWVSGLAHQQASTIRIEQEVGEVSIFNLQKQSEGLEVQKTIEQLTRVLEGK